MSSISTAAFVPPVALTVQRRFLRHCQWVPCKRAACASILPTVVLVVAWCDLAWSGLAKRFRTRGWCAGLAAAESCDLFPSVGTSGVVYPAAELPLRALGEGALVVHVNPVSFEASNQEFFLKGTAAQKLTELLASAFR